KGRLAMGTQRGREVYELMKMGALDGLSIGYRVDPKGTYYDEKGKRRYLKTVDLMEIS
ncbi:MAG TPA: HK97 family phage prohead protease, partial [Balneola sp.]|nr:HK97 family phage prohead protease [Balneola sp.]